MRLIVVALAFHATALAAEDERAAAREALAAGHSLFEQRTRSALEASLDAFRRARTLDPRLAPAWAGLASAQALLGLYGHRPPGETLPEARDAARRALELDEGLADAHAAHGLALYLHDWDWPRAERSFRRAIELAPHNATARHWYAMMLMATGRMPEALSEMREARRGDPGSLIVDVKLGTVLVAAGLLEEAEAQLVAARQRYPELPLVHRELGYLALAQERPGQALEHFERAQLWDRGTKGSAGLGYVYGLLGRTAEARELLAAIGSEAQGSYVSPLSFALIHSGLGEADATFTWLERAVTERDPGVVYLQVKPGFGPVRREPRFEKVLRRIGLPAR